MGSPLCPQCGGRVSDLETDEGVYLDATFCGFCDRIWAAGGGLEAYPLGKKESADRGSRA